MQVEKVGYKPVAVLFISKLGSVKMDSNNGYGFVSIYVLLITKFPH